MGDSGAGTHDLHTTGGRPTRVPPVVFVTDGATAHVGDDFHIPVRVRVKAGVRRDAVIVDNQQLAVAHLFRVVVVGKTKVVLGVEPAVISAAQTGKGVVS